MEGVKKNRVMHALTWCFLATALAYGIFYFGTPIFKRLLMALDDLWRSMAAYGYFMVMAEDGPILPTVQTFPAEMDTVLPLSWEEMQLFLENWWEIFKNEKTILAFGWLVFEKFALLLSNVSLFLLPIATLVFGIWLFNRDIDNDYAQNSRAVERFEKFRRCTWGRIKKAVIDYRAFVHNRWYYWLAFAIIWGYNLNILTIGVEALAWFFYLSWNGTLQGYVSIYVQVAKLAIDLSVVVLFIPGWAWAIIGYWGFSRWRRRLGDKKLRDCEREDDEFIERYPGALFVTGKQRSKKTSMLTMLKLRYERIFREKAKTKMLLRGKQFPFFPWINMERFIDQERKDHRIYMLYHCRKFIKLLRKAESISDEKKRTRYLALLKKRYKNYTWDDFYFGYDTAYGLEYNDGLVVIHLYDALEMYTQLYFIYHQQTSLDLSNLSIRDDFTWDDKGNFPVFDGDLLDRDAVASAQASKYSHIIPFDAFRPGLKFDPNNPYKDAVEYGIGVVQEVDKERKNSKTRSSAGNKAAGENGIATQDNDGFETDLKVRGQVALVDYVDFWVWLIDAQRVGDLGASNAELTNQVFIKGRAEEELKLPFFEVEDLLFEWLTKLYDSINEWFRHRKGSNVLMHHLIKLFFEPIFKAYDRIGKRYTVWKLKVKVTDGGDGEDLGIEVFWVVNYIVYRDRFASDVCKAFYEYRFEKSKTGIDDIECYTETTTNVEKMVQQDSYFAEDMTVWNGIESRRRRVAQKGKQTKK